MKKQTDGKQTDNTQTDKKQTDNRQTDNNKQIFVTQTSKCWPCPDQVDQVAVRRYIKVGYEGSLSEINGLISDAYLYKHLNSRASSKPGQGIYLLRASGLICSDTDTETDTVKSQKKKTYQ